RKWVLMTKAPLLDDKGTTLGLVGIARDVTERRHLEELRKRAQASLHDEAHLIDHAFPVLHELSALRLNPEVPPKLAEQLVALLRKAQLVIRQTKGVARATLNFLLGRHNGLEPCR